MTEEQKTWWNTPKTVTLSPGEALQKMFEASLLDENELGVLGGYRALPPALRDAILARFTIAIFGHGPLV